MLSLLYYHLILLYWGLTVFSYEQEWRAQQIASGEARDNANFQPLGGDWYGCFESTIIFCVHTRALVHAHSDNFAK